MYWYSPHPVAQICAKVMEHGVVPPTINLDHPDLEAGCDLDYVPNSAYTFPPDKLPRAILSDNLGFGGHNAAIVFRRYVKSEDK